MNPKMENFLANIVAALLIAAIAIMAVIIVGSFLGWLT